MPDPDPLRDAAAQALVYLSDYRIELMQSVCDCDNAGTPLRDTCDAIDAHSLVEIETIIDALATALTARTSP